MCNLLRCALLLVAGSFGTSPVAPDAGLRVIGQGMSFESSAGTRVFHDEASWTAFVKQSGLRAPSSNPDDPIPAVNFASESVVALLLGVRPTAGYRIEVDRVEGGSPVVVHARELVPCLGATVITYPMTAIAVSKFRGHVEVNWTRVPCKPSGGADW